MIVWIQAARLRTLPAALAPVLVGGAVAAHLQTFALVPWLLALLGATAIQVGTNFANDVFDAQKGADGPDRLGPSRAVASGAVSPSAMKRAMIAAFGVAAASGALLAWIVGWPVLAIGAASIASGIAYTGGPFPLAYNGLGDVFVFVFFGLVAVLGTIWVQSGTLPVLGVWCAVPVGLLAAAILVVNNVRDRHSDARVGKRTVIVRWGRRFGLIEYIVCMVFAYIVPGTAAATLGQPWFALPCVTLPLAVLVTYRVFQTDGRALNPLLGQTAAVLLAHSAMTSLGLLLAM